MISDIVLATSLLRKGHSFVYIDPSILTQSMCDEAVKTNFLNFVLVPEKFRTPELCFDAVKHEYNFMEKIKIPNFYNDYIKQIISFNPSIIQRLDKTQQTIELCNIALIQIPELIHYILEPTYNMISYAISRGVSTFNDDIKQILRNSIRIRLINDIVLADDLIGKSYLINFIDPFIMNDDRYYNAVRANSNNFKFVPEKFRTHKICYCAVLSDYENMKYIDNKSFYNEYISKIIENKPEYIQYLDETHQTPELCSLALTLQKEVLEFIINPTKDMILYVLLRNKNMLSSIHEKFRIDEVCDFSIEHDKKNLKYVPELYKQKYDLKHGTSLQNIIPEYHVPEIIKIAIEEDITNFCYVKNPSFELVNSVFNDSRFNNNKFKEQYKKIVQFVTEEQLKHYISNYPNSINQLIVYLKDSKYDKLIDGLIQISRKAIASKNNSTIEIRKVLEVYGYALKLIPVEKITEEYALMAVKQNGLALEFVPTEFKTSEVLLEAVKQNGLALEFVPTESKTDLILLEAVKQRVDSVKYVK